MERKEGKVKLLPKELFSRKNINSLVNSMFFHAFFLRCLTMDGEPPAPTLISHTQSPSDCLHNWWMILSCSTTPHLRCGLAMVWILKGVHRKIQIEGRKESLLCTDKLDYFGSLLI